jgi:hypothetical protein
MTSQFLTVTLAAAALAVSALVTTAPASATMMHARVVHQGYHQLVHYDPWYVDVDSCSVSTPIGGVNVCGGSDDNDEDDDD